MALDPNIILSAVLGFFGVLATAFGAVFVAKLNRKMSTVDDKVADVHTEVRTNHGMPASHYLEMIGDVKADIEVLRGESRGYFLAQSAALHEHSIQDAERFEALDERFDRLDRG